MSASSTPGNAQYACVVLPSDSTKVTSVSIELSVPALEGLSDFLGRLLWSLSFVVDRVEVGAGHESAERDNVVIRGRSGSTGFGLCPVNERHSHEHTRLHGDGHSFDA